MHHYTRLNHFFFNFAGRCPRKAVIISVGTTQTCVKLTFIRLAMKPENLTELTDQELLQKLKKLKTNKITDAVLIGFTIGIVVYSAVKNGFGFFTFFPLILTYIIVRNSNNNKILEKEIQKEIDSRNLTA